MRQREIFSNALSPFLEHSVAGQGVLALTLGYLSWARFHAARLESFSFHYRLSDIYGVLSFPCIPQAARATEIIKGPWSTSLGRLCKRLGEARQVRLRCRLSV